MSSKHLRIAIISSYSFKYPGGVQNQMIYHAAALNQLPNTEAHIWAADIKESYAPIATPSFSLGKGIQLAGNGSQLCISLSRYGIKQFLKNEHQYDLVHVHEPLYPQTSSLINALTIPVIGTFHAQFSSHFYYKYLNMIFRKTIKRINLATAVSKSARNSIKRYFNIDPTIIPNGTLPTPSPLRPYESRDPAILFIGRNEPRKGLSTLVKAFSLARKDVPNLKLWVSGKNTDRVTGKNIVNFGVISESKKFDLMSKCQILCVPSIGGESFGVILLEGMGSGCPVVASNIEGYRTVITNQDNGLLFQPKNHHELCNTLLSVLSDPQMANRLIANGHRTARSYTWNSIIHSYTPLYTQVINRQWSVKSRELSRGVRL